MRRLKALIIVLLLLLSYYSFADSNWENPIFINDTQYVVKDINIKTQAQGEPKNAAKNSDISNIIEPKEKHILKGELGGYFENSSIDLEQNTEWYIELKVTDRAGNTHYLYSKRIFNNQCSDGPALSLWPRKSEISKLHSKFIFTSHDNELFLRLEIYSKDGNLSNSYDFGFDEDWVETFDGRSLLAI